MNEMKKNISEYKIGHTTYIVKTIFDPAFQQSLSDILERLIKREIETKIVDEIDENE